MGLPALNEDDEQVFASVLDDFIARSQALRAMLIERAGYVLCLAGQNPELKSQEFATLASNAFNAIDLMAAKLGEPEFKILHQRGGRHQTLIVRVEEDCLLVSIFPAGAKVEEMEFSAITAGESVERHISQARKRAPETTVDLADQNPTSVDQVFFRKKPNA